jgi:hypothetical protein
MAGAQAQTAPPEGVNWGDYNVQQSVEFGYRFGDDYRNGNTRLFDTFVNLHDGPRVLEQSLSMRSLTNNGVLFDNLNISSFGWGGDPNNALRARVSKNKWYNFSGSFRRDQNAFNYPQFGNPLNPVTGYAVRANTFLGVEATSVPTPQILDSAHPFGVRRRMSDFNLTILPQAKVSVRMGYSRNRMTGPSYTSFHEGSDFMIGGNGDNTNTTGNTYRIGADFKVLPKTTISYDQTFDYYKNDTNYELTEDFGNVVLNTWAPAGYTSQAVNFGLPFFGAPINNPCAGFIVNTALEANPNCSGLYTINPETGRPGYYRNQRTRTSTPSEQLSFASRAIKRVDLSGRYIYSSADMKSPFTEDFYGGVTRTQERRFGQDAIATAKSINNSAELSATIHLTNKLRVLETFRYYAWRTPRLLTTTEWAQVPGLMSSATSGGSARVPGQAGFTPFLLLPIVGNFTPEQALTAAQSAFGAHGSSTPANYGEVTLGDFLGQKAKWNTVQVEYDIFNTLGARIGYRYGMKRDAEKLGFEEGTEYYYPNPDGVGNTPSGSALDYRGALAARRGNCARTVPEGVTQSIAANGVCTATISNELGEAEVFDVTEHTALFGLWARPSHALRFNAELELTSNDGAVTRISPRHQQHYRVRATFQPKSWATLSATYNGIESRNPGSAVPALPATLTLLSGTVVNVASQPTSALDINYRGSNRNFGVSASFTPNARFGFDVAYNYNQFKQNANVCPVYTNQTASSTGYASTTVFGLPVCPLFADQIVDGSGPDATVNSQIVSGETLQDGKFASVNHFLSVGFMFKPVKRLTTQFAYNISNNNGDMLVMSPWLGVGTPVTTGTGSNQYYMLPNTYGAPSTVASVYQTPSVSIAYEVAKNWTAKGTWSYYRYGEKAVAQGAGPNDYNSNMGLISVRYAF